MILGAPDNADTELPRERPPSRRDIFKLWSSLLFALLLIPANLLWIPDKVTSSGQTSSGYHFLLLDAISSQPIVDKRASSCFLFPQFQVPSSLFNTFTQVPQPPFFATGKNPFNTNWLIDYTLGVSPTHLLIYGMSMQTQKITTISYITSLQRINWYSRMITPEKLAEAVFPPVFRLL